MTPDTITKATETLARGIHTRSDARAAGAELGRTLAAQIRARETAIDQLNSVAILDMELTLLKLAAGSDDTIADVADSALQTIRERNRRTPDGAT